MYGADHGVEAFLVGGTGRWWCSLWIGPARSLWERASGRTALRCRDDAFHAEVVSLEVNPVVVNAELSGWAASWAHLDITQFAVSAKALVPAPIIEQQIIQQLGKGCLCLYGNICPGMQYIHIVLFTQIYMLMLIVQNGLGSNVIP